MSVCPGNDALLEAEVEELSGSSATPLGLHVRTCTRCRDAAERILDANAALDALLSARPGLDAAAVIARARRDPAAKADASPDRTGAWSRRAHIVRWTRTGWLALAAAASVAALLLWTGRTPHPNGTTWQPTAQAPPLVEPPPDRDVAVFETRDPDITVVWFF